MSSSWEKRFSWIELDRLAKEQEEVADLVNIVFYKNKMPIRKRQLASGEWTLEVPWIYEEVSKRAYDAYNKGQLDYSKDFEPMKPIQKQLMFHYEPIKLRSSRIFIFILVIFAFLGLVKILGQLGFF